MMLKEILKNKKNIQKKTKRLFSLALASVLTLIIAFSLPAPRPTMFSQAAEPYEITDDIFKGMNPGDIPGLSDAAKKEIEEKTKEAMSKGWTPWWLSPTNVMVELVKKMFEYVLRSILYVLYIVSWVFYSLVYGLVKVSEWILGLIFDPALMQALGGFTTASFVRDTANTLANLCNMIYIFILFYIAIMTMLGRADTYRWLTKLVVAALLTNFALVLSGLVIDFSQVVMYTIYDKGDNFTIGTDILKDLEKYIHNSEIKSSAISQDPSSLLGSAESLTSNGKEENFGPATTTFFFTAELKAIISRIFHMVELIIFALIMAVTLIAIATILVSRIIVLWILLIVSPAAFLFYAFPGTDKYFKQWFENLTKYAFTGPILIFFLWLASAIARSLKEKGNISKFDVPAAGASFKEEFYAFIGNNFSVFFQFLTLTIIVWAGIIIADKFGIKGASNMDNLIKKTKTLRGATVMALGKFVGATKVGSWGGIGALNKFRARRMEIRGSRLADMEARLGAMPQTDPERAKLEKDIEKQRKRIDTIKGRKEKSEKLKNRMMKLAALTSPTTIKKAFSTYADGQRKEYISDVDNALRDFSNYWMNVHKSKKIKANEADEKLNDYQSELNKLFKELEKIESDYKAAATPQEKNKINEKKITVSEKIKAILKGIAEVTTEDKDEQKQIATTLENNIFDKFKELEVGSPQDNKKIEDSYDWLSKGILNKANIDDADKSKIKEILSDKIIEAIEKQDETLLNAALTELKNEVTRLDNMGLLDPGERWRIMGAVNTVLPTTLTPGGKINPKLLVKAHEEIKDLANITHKEALIENAGKSLGKDLFSEAKRTAKKGTQEFLVGFKVREEKAKKVKEKLEEMRKKGDEFNAEEAARRVTRGGMDPIEQEATIIHLSASSRNFAKLVDEIDKKIGNKDKDMAKTVQYIEDRTSHEVAMRALRTAQTDAEKTNNLTQMGHVTFDSIQGKYRVTSKNERQKILSEITGNISPVRRVTRIHSRVFEFDQETKRFKDVDSTRNLIDGTDWENIGSNPRIVETIQRDIPAKIRESLKNNAGEFASLIKDSPRRKAFEDIVNNKL